MANSRENISKYSIKNYGSAKSSKEATLTKHCTLKKLNKTNNDQING